MVSERDTEVSSKRTREWHRTDALGYTLRFIGGVKPLSVQGAAIFIK